MGPLQRWPVYPCRLSLFWLVVVLWLLHPYPLAAQSQGRLYVPLVPRYARLDLPGQILFTSMRDGNAEIYVMDANGDNPINLTQHPAIDIMARWSPDGRQVAFVSKRHDPNGGAEVYVMNADGSDVRRLTYSEIAAITPNWSPDGKRIVFAQVVGVTDPDDPFPLLTELYSVRLDGSDRTRLTFTGPPYYQRHIFLESPSWSPDGSRILTTIVVTYPSHAFVNLVTAKPGERELEDVDFGLEEGVPPPQAQHASWSPDGSQIVYSSVDSSGRVAQGIHVFTLATQEWLFLTNKVGDAYPTWSPDGAHIAFTSVVDEQSDIYVMGADGSQPVRITTHPEADFDPDWH